MTTEAKPQIVCSNYLCVFNKKECTISPVFEKQYGFDNTGDFKLLTYCTTTKICPHYKLNLLNEEGVCILTCPKNKQDILTLKDYGSFYTKNCPLCEEKVK